MNKIWILSVIEVDYDMRHKYQRLLISDAYYTQYIS